MVNPASTPVRKPTDRVAVVVNGNAKQVTTELVQTLDQIVKSGDLFVSRSLEEGRAIARDIVERGYRTVLTGGGDGTFVQMVTWIVAEATEQEAEIPRFGLLKLGTGNALAWVLGAQNLRGRGRGVVADLARLRSEGGSRDLRLIEVEGYLTPFAGLGADAVAVQDYVTARDAFLRTPLLKHVASGPVVYATSLLTRTVPKFLFGRAQRVRIINTGSPALRLDADGKPIGAAVETGQLVYEGPARILAMSTIPYWGFGARVFPFAEEREDRFNLRLVNFGSIEAVANVQSIWRGTYTSDRLHDFLVDAIAIECSEPTPIQIGGDVIGTRTAFEAKLSERRIPVVDYYAPPPMT